MMRYLLLILITIGLSISPAFAFKNIDEAISAHGKTQTLSDTDISRFTQAISEIKEFYVEPVNDKKLLEDAIRGMLTGLDPHSEYLDEDSYKTLLMTTNGEFAGLGIEVTGEFGVLKVVSPIDDTPASKAGIKSGDYIVALDNKLVNEMTLNEAVDKMRGKKGTPIIVTIIRKGEKNPINLKLTRDVIHISSVKSKLIDGYGYVRISQFQEPTTELMIAAIDQLKKSSGGKLKGLILDLRNNPGGLLETAVQITDTFLSNKNLDQYQKLIVYTDGRQPKNVYKAKSKNDDILAQAPLVILINEGSASASEIVAGALQDYHRAMIIGKTSFGKGSVQTVLPLDQTHAIKLTTALYHTPAGRIIQNIGIIPDIVVDDLKITPEKNIDTAMLTPIKEFNLKGHLAGQTKPTEEQVPGNNGLAQEDFQLYQAVEVLKTMSLVSRNISPIISQTTVAKGIVKE